jgi:tetratricopeptide (TPR) repeat protein
MSGHNDSGVISQTITSKWSRLKRTLVFVVAGIVVVAALIALWLVVVKDKSPTPMPTDTYAASIKEADSQAATGDYVKESRTLETMLASRLSDEQRKTVMIKVASSYTNGLQVDKAIAAYDNLQTKYPSESFVAKRGLALLYMRFGESSKNVDYLQKSVSYFEEVIQIEKTDTRYQQLIMSDSSNLRYVKKLLEAK